MIPISKELIIVGATTLALAGTFFLGVEYEDRKWKAKESTANTQAEQKARKTEADLAQLQLETTQLKVDLKSAQDELSKRIPYVLTDAQKSDSCNSSRGGVQLLNSARGYSVGTRENPRLTKAEEKQESAYTGERLFTDAKSCEDDYLTCVTDFNQLVTACELLENLER